MDLFRLIWKEANHHLLFRSSISKVELITSLFHQFYVLILALMEMIYIELGRQMDDPFKELNRATIERYRSMLESNILTMCPMSPKLTGVSMMVYIFITITMIFWPYLENFTFRERANCPGSLIPYLFDPVKGNEDICEIFNRLIREMMASNLNYSAKLARRKIKEKMELHKQERGDQFALNRIVTPNRLDDYISSLVKQMSQSPRIDNNEPKAIKASNDIGLKKDRYKDYLDYYGPTNKSKQASSVMAKRARVTSENLSTITNERSALNGQYTVITSGTFNEELLMPRKRSVLSSFWARKSYSEDGLPIKQETLSQQQQQQQLIENQSDSNNKLSNINHAESHSNCDKNQSYGSKIDSDIVDYEFASDMRLLSREHQFLKQLLESSDKKFIWPANRHPEWLKSIKRTWFYLYTICYATILLSIIFSGLFTLIVSDRHMKAFNYEKPVAFLNFRAIFIITVLFYSYRNCEAFVSPSCQNLIAVFDVVKLNWIVRDQIHDFRKLIGLLRSIIIKSEHLIGSLHQSLNDKINNDNNNNNVISNIEQIRYECNKQSIQIYMTFRYVIIQYNMLKPVSHTIVSGVVGVIATVGLLLVRFHHKINGEYEYMPMFTMAIVCIIAFHLAAGICAIVNASMMYTVDMFWSLVYCSQMQILRNPLATCNSQTNKGSFIATNEQDANLSYELINEQSNLTSKMTHSDSNSHQDVLVFMSPHLICLWSKLITSEKLRNNFIVEALGFVPLDYAGVLNFDIWLISLIMLSVVYLDV